jgi:hypothetical protein
VLRDKRATPLQAQKTPAREGDGEFGPNSSLLVGQRPLWVFSLLAPRFGPNSARHAAHAEFSDSL